MTLACLRLGMPATYAKGADTLPPEATGPVREALVRSLDIRELCRAHRAATAAFLVELRESDPQVSAILQKPLGDLVARCAGRGWRRTRLRWLPWARRRSS